MNKKLKYIALAAFLMLSLSGCTYFSENKINGPEDVTSKIVNAQEYKNGITFEQIKSDPKYYAGCKFILKGRILKIDDSDNDVKIMQFETEAKDIINCAFVPQTTPASQGSEAYILAIFLGIFQKPAEAYGTSFPAGYAAVISDISILE